MVPTQLKKGIDTESDQPTKHEHKTRSILKLDQQTNRRIQQDELTDPEDRRISGELEDRRAYGRNRRIFRMVAFASQQVSVPDMQNAYSSHLPPPFLPSAV